MSQLIKLTFQIRTFSKSNNKDVDRTTRTDYFLFCYPLPPRLLPPTILLKLTQRKIIFLMSNGALHKTFNLRLSLIAD
jgi:hypothetical protein